MVDYVACRTCGTRKLQTTGYSRDPRTATGYRAVCKVCTRGTVNNTVSVSIWGCTVKQKPEPMMDAWVKAMGATLKDGKVVGGKRFKDAETHKVWRLK